VVRLLVIDYQRTRSHVPTMDVIIYSASVSSWTLIFLESFQALPPRSRSESTGSGGRGSRRSLCWEFLNPDGVSAYAQRRSHQPGMNESLAWLWHSLEFKVKVKFLSFFYEIESLHRCSNKPLPPSPVRLHPQSAEHIDTGREDHTHTHTHTHTHSHNRCFRNAMQ